VRHAKELVGMVDLDEPPNLGVEITAQQEVGSNLGGTRQLVRQSKKGVSHLAYTLTFTMNTTAAWLVWRFRNYSLVNG